MAGARSRSLRQVDKLASLVHLEWPPVPKGERPYCRIARSCARHLSLRPSPRDRGALGHA
jgi:hypothetical protein